MPENITRAYNGSSILRHPRMIGVVLFSAEASFSILANLLVVSLFAFRRHLLRNPHNRCILNLAVTDIFTSISVFLGPKFVLGEKFYITKLQNYFTRELYCRFLWNNCLQYSLALTSLYTSVVLSLERWLCVRRSIFYKCRFQIRHMNMLIVAAWVTAFASQVSIIGRTEGEYNESWKSCRYTLKQNKTMSLYLSIAVHAFQVVIPMVLITLAYIDVFRGIKASLLFAASARAENVSSINRLNKVTNVAVTTTFILVAGWIPSSTWYFVSLIRNEPRDDPYDPLIMFGAFLVFGNGCINPCIYVFLNPELRNALRAAFSTVVVV